MNGRFIIQKSAEGEIIALGTEFAAGMENEIAFTLRPQDGEMIEGANYAAINTWLQGHPDQCLVTISKGVIAAAQPEPDEE
jgi:hypothetical protein